MSRTNKNHKPYKYDSKRMGYGCGYKKKGLRKRVFKKRDVIITQDEEDKSN